MPTSTLHAFGAALVLATALAASPVPSEQWDARGNQVLSAQEALAALESLPPDAPAAVS